MKFSYNKNKNKKLLHGSCNTDSYISSSAETRRHCFQCLYLGTHTLIIALDLMDPHPLLNIK